MGKRVALPEKARRILLWWYNQQLLEETCVLRGSLFGTLFARFGQHAVTINGTVHLTSQAQELDSDAGIVLLGHECYHVVQQSEQGWWAFLARYIWHWRPSHVRHGWKHPLESPAYERAREIHQTLG